MQKKKTSKTETAQALTAYQVIAKKRDGEELEASSIKWFNDSFTQGKIPDYQMASLLMAIYLKGMTTSETAAMTDCMLYSGKVLDFADATVVDKHSTGGVGDKTSFLIAPLAAACGVKVPMVAGRGLGHTGGTVDKIEAIPNFRTNLSLEEFADQLVKEGMVLIGQTKDIAPADGKIYALRDVTATIESIPLITASIMSKKLAEGASGLVLDIKAGRGAFMKNLSRARALAKSLRETSLRFNRNIMTSITDMNQPLGETIGHSMELIECFEILKGRGPKDLTDVSLHLAGGMVHLAGKAKTLEAGIAKVKKALKSGQGLSMMKHLIELQGGNSEVLNDYTLLPSASKRTYVTSSQDGYLSLIDPITLGLGLIQLGGGRNSKEDKIDFGVVIKCLKKVGAKIKKGTPLLEIHHHEHQSVLAQKLAQHFIQDAITISPKMPEIPNLIVETQIKWSPSCTKN